MESLIFASQSVQGSLSIVAHEQDDWSPVLILQKPRPWIRSSTSRYPGLVLPNATSLSQVPISLNLFSLFPKSSLSLIFLTLLFPLLILPSPFSSLSFSSLFLLFPLLLFPSLLFPLHFSSLFLLFFLLILPHSLFFPLLTLPSYFSLSLSNPYSFLSLLFILFILLLVNNDIWFNPLSDKDMLVCHNFLRY